ncbi:MAG: CoB--CoM heterodisulfide reductase iron-sulfur subunit A family protein [Chloroflexota bacterium]|nr:MAG: CoB--CoM heterodisulfide reductase iron-sulfur subunit A family protein [Chloroflexota bacterium]
MPKVRIGVFVCHCGRNIGGYVDVPRVVEYASGLPNVVHAEHNLFTCSVEGTSAIKKAVGEHNLNRVVVASCTPMTHEALFRSTCEEVGLNKYLFEMANIRDQCAWVHMECPREATEKAKRLVASAVAKARLLEPLQEIKIEVLRSCLVIGGGIAGMTAALNLADQGFHVDMVEKETELGGNLLTIHKLFPANKNANELITPVIRQVKEHGNISAYLSAKVKAVTGFIGNYDVTLDHEGEEIKIKAGTILVAIGAEEFKPIGQYGYGEMTGVLTQLELEKQMKEGKVDGQNIVMINCVGSRTAERSYCSRFCCVVAIKNAALIKESNPAANVWVLNRDLMAYGIDFEDYYRKAQEAGVRFIRYDLARPPQIIGNGHVEGVKVFHQLRQNELELPCDKVVLTTPLVPRSDNDKTSKILKVPLSQEGFFMEAHLKLRPVEFATDGIFVCGSARWPVEVSEATFQGCAAAAKAAIPMRMGYVKPEAITASVDSGHCAGCGICATLCPYNAIELKSENGKRSSSVLTALCKGCGTCAAACPSGAISMDHFRTEQIMAQIEALLEC